MSEEKKIELNPADLDLVGGGENEDLEHNYTVFACNQCGKEVKWPGTEYLVYGEYAVDCECGCKVYHRVRKVY